MSRHWEQINIRRNEIDILMPASSTSKERPPSSAADLQQRNPDTEPSPNTASGAGCGELTSPLLGACKGGSPSLVSWIPGSGPSQWASAGRAVPKQRKTCSALASWVGVAACSPRSREIARAAESLIPRSLSRTWVPAWQVQRSTVGQEGNGACV